MKKHEQFCLQITIVQIGLTTPARDYERGINLFQRVLKIKVGYFVGVFHALIFFFCIQFPKNK